MNNEYGTNKESWILLNVRINEKNGNKYVLARYTSTYITRTYV